ncbi:hypothetical protein GJAV_G00126230 [Gymnothorax javanicus]|nr:hypothetical protein GJAV_G00126230 [Gymnothorax javanicus]
MSSKAAKTATRKSRFDQYCNKTAKTQRGFFSPVAVFELEKTGKFAKLKKIHKTLVQDLPFCVILSFCRSLFYFWGWNRFLQPKKKSRILLDACHLGFGHCVSSY